LTVRKWDLQPARDLGLPETQRWRSLRRESGLVAWAARLVWWWWVKGVLRLLTRVQVQGSEHLPAAPPFVLVANHSSHLDVLVLACALPLRLRHRTLPLAAGDTFFETPAMAAFAAGLMNALPMWRKNCGRHSIEALRQRLAGEPCAYILFPEGTRSRTGHMGPFKHGVGMLVAGTLVPVFPCRLQGTFASLPPGKTWPRPRRIRLRIGPPLTFAEVANDRPGWQSIADRLAAAVVALDDHADSPTASSQITSAPQARL
jgi:1-acyl-sn-glycerol-3-phosphate acyltransferase